MNEILRHRWKLLAETEQGSKYVVQLQENSSVQATIDGHEVTLSFLPSSGKKQIQAVFIEPITLYPGDKLGYKLVKTNDVIASGFVNVSFWTGKVNYIVNNKNLGNIMNVMQELSATETLTGGSCLWRHELEAKPTTRR